MRLSMQVTTCQWSFIIQLLEFQNLMNIETMVKDNNEILYCCCDEVDTCKSETAFDMNTENCPDRCDIFFLLSLSDESSELYSLSTIKGTIIDSSPQSLYGYTFSLVLDDIPNLVRCILVTVYA